MTMTSGTVRERTLKVLKGRPKTGATSVEIANRIGAKPKTVSARLTELTQEGKVTSTGRRRSTANGGTATIFRVRA